MSSVNEMLREMIGIGPGDEVLRKQDVIRAARDCPVGKRDTREMVNREDSYIVVSTLIVAHTETSHQMLIAIRKSSSFDTYNLERHELVTRDEAIALFNVVKP